MSGETPPKVADPSHGSHNPNKLPPKRQSWGEGKKGLLRTIRSGRFTTQMATSGTIAGAVTGGIVSALIGFTVGIVFGGAFQAVVGAMYPETEEEKRQEAAAEAERRRIKDNGGGAELEDLSNEQ